jgi:hypothetical protein
VILIRILVFATLLTGDFIIDNVAYQPTDFFVGDRVVMTVRLTGTGEPELAIPDIPIESNGFLIESIRISGNSNYREVDIVFRSFIPGSSEFPSLDLGEYRLEGLTVYTTPLLDKGIELRPLRAQMVLPGTRLYSGLLVVFILGLPFLFYFIIKALVRLFRGIFLKYRKRKPYRRFTRVIKRLDTGLQLWDNKTFFIMLIEGLKTYLTDKTGKDFITATTGEIRKLRNPLFNEKELNTLLELLRQGDMVKFAGETLPGEGRKIILGEAVQLVDSLEHKEAYDADI